MTRREFVWTLAATSVCLPTLEDELRAAPQESKTRAKRIMDALREKYARLKSYQDTGKAYTRAVQGGEKFLSRKLRFSTWFERPNKFRFAWEYVGEFEKHIVASDGRETYFCRQGKGEYTREKMENLEMAIAEATGASIGTARNIPILLMPEPDEFNLSKLDDLTLLRAEKAGRGKAYVLSGRRNEADDGGSAQDSEGTWTRDARDAGDIRGSRSVNGANGNSSEYQTEPQNSQHYFCVPAACRLKRGERGAGAVDSVNQIMIGISEPARFGETRLVIKFM